VEFAYDFLLFWASRDTAHSTVQPPRSIHRLPQLVRNTPLKPAKTHSSLILKMEPDYEERPRKRFKSANDSAGSSSTPLPRTLTSTISPPPLRRGGALDPAKQQDTEGLEVIDSPVQLTWIQDLPEESNRDAVTLNDLLGDPMISECWEFNYLHDLDFLMNAFDQDVCGMIKVHVVHGFWKSEDPARLRLQVMSLFYCYPIQNLTSSLQ